MKKGKLVTLFTAVSVSVLLGTQVSSVFAIEASSTAGESHVSATSSTSTASASASAAASESSLAASSSAAESSLSASSSTASSSLAASSSSAESSLAASSSAIAASNASLASSSAARSVPVFNSAQIASRLNNHAVLSQDKIAQNVSMMLPQSQRVNNAIKSAQTSSVYENLTTNSQRLSYVYWNAYWNYYYVEPLYNYYPWMPYWFHNSNYAKNNKHVIELQNVAKARHLKWIKVSDKIVFVPQSLWRKIKVGDKVELIDNTHIKVNSKIFNTQGD